MNAVYTKYDKLNGEILGVYHCTEDVIKLNLFSDHHEFTLGHFDYSSEYISNGAAVPRPKLSEPSSFSVPMSFNNLPIGTEILVDNVSQGFVEDGELIFDCEHPGTYLLELKPPFPYISRTYQVTVP